MVVLHVARWINKYIFVKTWKITFLFRKEGVDRVCDIVTAKKVKLVHMWHWTEHFQSESHSPTQGTIPPFGRAVVSLWHRSGSHFSLKARQGWCHHYSVPAQWFKIPGQGALDFTEAENQSTISLSKENAPITAPPDGLKIFFIPPVPHCY